MTEGVTAQLLFDGTFSTEAVAAAGHQLVQQLHDEAMAAIATLAETWDRPVEEGPSTVDEEPVTYRDPATWSVADDEDEPYGDDDAVLVLPRVELPALLPRPRRTVANTTAPVAPAVDVAAAATDEFAVPAEPQYA